MSDQTTFSAKAFDLASSFKAALGGMELAPGEYHAELTTPDGPSTGGGVQALQQIRLVPKKEGYLPLHVGNANKKSGTAEIKTFAHLEALHIQRFSRSVDVDKEQYEKFVAAAQKFLKSMQITVTLTEAPAAKAPISIPSAGATGEAKGGFPVATIVLVAVGVLVTWLLLRK